MPTPDVDAGRILEVLDRHRVAYVVIGGLAIELHDVAVPPTRDVDITPRSTPANLKRLGLALDDLNARLRVPDPPEGIEVPGGISVYLLQTMSVLTLVTDAGPLDISLTPAGTGGYADLVERQVEITLGDRPVPVAALEDVLRSKEAAGREKDFLAIPAIRAHLRRQGRL